MKKIEFVESTHTYLYGGVIIPSVSELIRFKFPKQYDGVPEKILKNKAQYGTKVHQLVEDLFLKRTTLEEIQSKRIDPNTKVSVEQAESLRKNWCFYIKDSEKIVTYKGKYAGTYDLITDDDFIIDIKTTTEIHEEWLSWQLGLYYLASGIEQSVGYVMSLPKGKPGVVKPITVKSWDECKELVKEYEKHITD